MGTFSLELYKEVISNQNKKDLISILSCVDEIPFSELMTTAKISKDTANLHLNMLEQYNIAFKKTRGKHRYYSINPLYKDRFNKEKDIQLITPEGKSIDKRLHDSRTCYNHLAGKLGVTITNYLLTKSFLIEKEQNYIITETGKHFFTIILDIDLNKVQKSKRIIAGKCLDCSERKYHLSGSLGDAILKKFIELEWINKIQDRKVIVTDKGSEALVSLFDDLNSII